MDPATALLLMKFVVYPLVKELATRRGIHGVTPENIKAFAKDPDAILKVLAEQPGVRKMVIVDLADAVDNVLNEAVNAVGELFKVVTPGGVVEDDT